MPFTLAHPAIVLPFIRLNPRMISATGLIAGSMSPDFEYFFKMSVEGIYGHTFWGLIYFNIPVAIFISFVFHQVVKKSFLKNFPTAIRNRLHILEQFDFKGYFRKNFGVFILSAWVGAASHIFWDAFTHNDGYFAMRLSIYRSTSFPFFGVDYPLFFVLQHVSTIIGLLSIVLYIGLIKPPSREMENKFSYFYWMSILLITFVAVGLRFAIKSADLNPGNFVVSTISGFFLALFIAGLFTKRSITKI